MSTIDRRKLPRLPNWGDFGHELGGFQFSRVRSRGIFQYEIDRDPRGKVGDLALTVVRDDLSREILKKSRRIDILRRCARDHWLGVMGRKPPFPPLSPAR